MTFGIAYAATSLLALRDHVQERFLQEIDVLVLDALLVAPALPHPGRGELHFNFYEIPRL